MVRELLALLVSATLQPGALEAPVFQPFDLIAPLGPDGLEPAEVTFFGPEGERLSLAPFTVSDGTRVVRFAPTSLGLWTMGVGAAAEKSDRTAVCTAVANPRSHGRLRIDPERPRHFRWEDGAPFFPVGIECDWLFAIDLGSREGGIARTEAFLDKLVAHGFNYIVMNVYAHDTAWRLGTTEDADFGPPALYPWRGSNEAPDHAALNPAFWEHFDRVVAAMHDRGVVAHIMIKVYNKMVNWPQRGSAEERQYLDALLARYAAYPNIVWDFSKESYNEKDLAYKIATLRHLRDHDPYGHLLTVHDDDEPYERGDYDDVVDFRSDQHHSDFHATILRQRARREWPILQIEFGYEHGPGGIEDKTYGVAQPPAEVLDRAWRIAMAGAYVNYYYTYTAWDVVRTDDDPPGYAMMGRLGEFFSRVDFARLEPRDDLVSGGHCLARPGEEYVVYLPDGGDVGLRIEGDQALSARWFLCLEGVWAAPQTVGPGATALRPPRDWDGPVAVHVRR